jgi:soluble lytic murein transglycosylase
MRRSWRLLLDWTALLLALGAGVPAPAQEAAAVRELGAAVALLEAGNAAGAARALAPLPARLPVLADYAAFFLGQARFQLKDHANVPAALEPVFRAPAHSPLMGRAAVLAARSLLETGEAQNALSWLNRVPAGQRAEPESSLLAAKAQESLGQPVAAVAAWKTIYYYYPVSREATEAEAALARLKRSLAQEFPPAPAEARFDRTERLIKARQFDAARADFHEMAAELSGLDRERAMVRAAATLYEQKNTTAAISQLNALHLEEQEADAERWYWLAAAHRRANRDEGMEAALAQLARRAPDSPWRRDALVLAGNRYLVENDHGRYLPHFAACGSAFPDDADGAYCHWKVVWRAWLERSPRTGDLLREHLRDYSAFEKGGAALYYLARLAEKEEHFGAAKRYYSEAISRFPNYYYAMLAREELKKPSLAAAVPDEGVDRFLRSIPFPGREQAPSFASDPETALRVRRGRLLAQARLERWAESEMRFGARDGRQPVGAGDGTGGHRGGARRARAGAALHQGDRARVPVPAARSRAGEVLAARLPVPLPGGNHAVRPPAQPGSVLRRGLDPPGVRIRSRGGFARRRHRPDADHAADGKATGPATQARRVDQCAAAPAAV